MRLVRTVVLLALAALALLAPAARASTSQTGLFEAPRELLSDDAALRAHTLDEIQEFGVNWVRVVVYWQKVAPNASSSKAPSFDESDPNAYGGGFTPYDRAILELRARGMHVMVTISGPVPKWATSTHRDYVTKPSVARWQRFVTAVGRRYHGMVDTWSIWNEPNLIKFLAPQFVRHGRAYSPGLYRRLFFAAYNALHATGNNQPILMGETEPRGGSKAVAPLRFLRGALCLSSRYHKSRRCARLPADGYAHHAYTTAAGPFFHPRERDDVTIGVLGRLNHALDLAARAHALKRHLPIYLTEFGIQSYPDPFIGVSLTKQAEYRSISERIAYLNPRVRMFSQYLMRDDNPRRGSRYARYSGFESGLRFANGRVKPSYAGYRLPLVVHRSSRRHVTLWGLVRPHVGRARVTVQLRRARSKRWSKLFAATSNTRGYWRRTARYRAGAWYRVVWTSPSGHGYWGPATRTY